MNDSLQSSPHIDYLSRLPNELLEQIFDDAYMNWEDGKKDWRTPKTLARPLSKRFLEIQRVGLYRYIRIEGYSSLRKLESFFQAILDQPELGSLVSSFHFHVDDSSSNSRSPATVVLDSVDDVFCLLPNLTTLQLTGDAIRRSPSLLQALDPSVHNPNCKSVTLKIDHHSIKMLSKLSPLLTFFDLTIQYHWMSNPTNPRFPLFSHLSTLKFSGSSDHAQMCKNLVAQCPKLVEVHLKEKNGGSLVSLILSKISTPTRIKTLSISTRQDQWDLQRQGRPVTQIQISAFTNLKSLSLGGGCSSGSEAFLVALRGVPIEELSLEVGEAFALSSLIGFVSPPNQHPTLNRLVLNLIEEKGEIGTRVAEVDFEQAFSQIDPDTDDVEDDAMTDNWTLPKFPPGFSIKQAVKLRNKGSENGVEVVGRVYEGIAIQQAYDDDVETLGELWNEWKKKGKKSKQSGRTRKSKK